MCVFVVVRHERNVLHFCSLSFLTSAGAAPRVLTHKMPNISAGESRRDFLKPFAIPSSCLSAVWVSPTRHNPLTNCQRLSSLSRWRHIWRFTSCFMKKMCCSRLAAPGLLAYDPVVECVHLPAGFSYKVWPGTLEGVFWVPHFQLSASTVFLQSLMVIPRSFCEGHIINNPQV